MKKILFIITIAALVLSFTACSKEEIKDTLPLETDTNTGDGSDSQLVVYGVAGFITEINTDGNGDILASILVEGKLDENGADYDKGYVSIDANTVIYLSKQGTIEDLEVGQYVQVFYEGAVAESYPVQGYGRQINVIDDPIFVEDFTEKE